MDSYIEESCDNIDAAFFSGDTFHNLASLNDIKYYLARWNKEAKVIEDILEENSHG